MNKKYIDILFVGIWLLVFVAGCKEHNKEIAATHRTYKIKPAYYKIDYKWDEYHLYLGQSLDSVRKIIDLSTQYADEFRLDFGDSIDFFNNFIGPLIIAKMPDTIRMVPALCLYFKDGQLVRFNCSIVSYVLELNSKNVACMSTQLRSYFSGLGEQGVVGQLVKTHEFKKINTEVTEVYHFDTSLIAGWFCFDYDVKLPNECP